MGHTDSTPLPRMWQSPLLIRDTGLTIPALLSTAGHTVHSQHGHSNNSSTKTAVAARSGGENVNSLPTLWHSAARGYRGRGQRHDSTCGTVGTQQSFVVVVVLQSIASTARRRRLQREVVETLSASPTLWHSAARGYRGREQRHDSTCGTVGTRQSFAVGIPPQSTNGNNSSANTAVGERSGEDGEQPHPHCHTSSLDEATHARTASRQHLRHGRNTIVFCSSNTTKSSNNSSPKTAVEERRLCGRTYRKDRETATTYNRTFGCSSAVTIVCCVKHGTAHNKVIKRQWAARQ